MSCSSNYNSNSRPANILTFNENYWLSQDDPNPWICFKLNSKKIFLSGYLFRSLFSTNYCNPKSWKLEASNDNINWILIDKQVNRDWVTHQWIEVYFPVEAKESYSYFKFTQTGNSYCNSLRFLLNFVEFFGAIIDQ
jgi:hypothetical protein